MNAAKFADRLARDKFLTVRKLHPRTLYALARKSTPHQVIDEVIDRSSSGDVVPFVDVKRMLDSAREQKREAYRKEKEAGRRRRLTKKQREREDALKAERESPAYRKKKCSDGGGAEPYRRIWSGANRATTGDRAYPRHQ
jgi:hypothetical protein